MKKNLEMLRISKWLVDLVKVKCVLKEKEKEIVCQKKQKQKSKQTVVML